MGKASNHKEFGGELPVDPVNGKLLVQFLKLFSAQFERECDEHVRLGVTITRKLFSVMDKAGYGIHDEESKKQLNKGIQETLSYITKK